MNLFLQAWGFLSAGGTILWWIIAVLAVMLFLLAERWLFLKLEFPRIAQHRCEQWLQRQERNSWYARVVREEVLELSREELYRSFSLIKALVMVCPMLGLLGTVTGMIGIFDLLSLHGALWMKFMESGIARATIPTLAGMVVALIGLLLFNRLETAAKRAMNRMADQMVRE
ncbi:MotA/TolQ/ExbB proton channel family protein [Dongshaea marina]|uniref:MotA/TolQ/ExbB proton channel family protein n=1 Tax=Dongshaea marina TaxID=2047966 RepID=UPI000D3E6DD5|nr:MotA/TolQ/ExbB proton channel family protein [Dongshaea marina]